MLKVKICGVTSVRDALVAARAGADYVGLIFAESPRHVDAATARGIVQSLPKTVKPVGVFMDQPLDEVRRTLAAAGLRLAQLHGSESPAYCRRVGVPVFKVFDTFDAGTLRRLRRYDAFAYVLDLPKKGPSEPQIDLDWALQARRHGRVILSGKLDARNVGAMIAQVRPYGVDSCRGTEKSPGIKDPAKVCGFIRVARGKAGTR